MKIGIVTTWFERGAAYVSKQFMEVLQKTDEVYIYARGGEKYAKGNPVWDLPNVWWGKRMEAEYHVYGYAYIDKTDFEKWIKLTGVECVFFNEQRYYQPLIWVKDLGIKSVAYIDYYTEDTIPLFDAYDCVICNTKRHAFAMRNHKNVQYLKWGTNVNLYRPTNITHEKVTFFHSAGMAPHRKGTDILIRSFYKCANRKKGKLFIHTQVSLTKLYPELSDIISEMENDGSMELCENTVTAPGLYHKGDVYVYPSRLDGIGLTLMEAISAGLAIITIDNAPMNEFVEPEFGDVCSVEYYYCRYDAYYWPMSVASEDSLTTILTDYIAKPECLDKKKKAARNYALKELDFNKNMESLSRIMHSTKSTPISKKLRSMLKEYDASHFTMTIYFKYWLRETIKKIPGVKSYLSNRR